jgi:hypothetical protein
MKSSAKPPLRAGDRVRERSGNTLVVATAASPNLPAVKRITGSRRQGMVVAVETRRNSRGHQIAYAYVQWDHLQSPSLHASQRLERITD